jgi:Ca2+-binding RTX toxin-like protein
VRLGLVIPLVALVAVSVVTLTASNSVPATRLDDARTVVTANALKPPECAALNLTSIVVGGVTLGTGSNGLVLGTSGPDTLRGRGGEDCIVAGAGNDRLIGGGGFDVCIGGPGTDTFSSCARTYQ